jgi:elongator complex protein 3
MKKLIRKLINAPDLNIKKLSQFKRQYAKKTGHMLKNTKLLSQYKNMVLTGKIKENKKLENILQLKKVRSLSGIVPVAVLTKPYFCPGNCVYCPTQENMPKSYLNDEPAVMRALAADFDPFLQVQRRLKQLVLTGHRAEKIELIIMGGTFSALPEDYQIDFVAKCYLAANNLSIKKLKNYEYKNFTMKVKGLEKQQVLNQKAKFRIIGLTLETRPDQISQKTLKLMRKLGATRVEIGVQTTDNKILKLVKRGHGVKETIKATQLLKDAGFKVGYHLMPNLPGSSFKKDINVFKKIFTDSLFMPDMIKIYPCVVVYQAELFSWLKNKKYKPYTEEKLIALLVEIKKLIPPWVRIMRLGRDIPVKNIAAGFTTSNIRQVLQKKIKEKKFSCQCIRCWEVKEKTVKPEKLKLSIIKYKASGGLEYFLQYIDKNNRLYALLRLRIPSQIISTQKPFIPALAKAGIIRELHTFGKALGIGKKGKSAQHQGLGKKLLKKAEEILKEHKINKIAVISGIGVRGYYQSLGYKLENTYMTKKLIK